MPTGPPKSTFEEKISEIDIEIRKRKNKWNLNALNWLDFDDVSQILRIHIYKKWHLYDPIKPLAPWLNRIISNQIKNIIRNNYGNYCRPCLKCAAAEGADLCKIYGKQDTSCPLYACWYKNKKTAYDLKIPVPLENHSQEVSNIPQNDIDVLKCTKIIHDKMQNILKPVEWKVYKYLYIENKDEEETAILMGYKTSEKNRSPGYKQIKNIKKAIVIKVKKYILSGEIDFY